MRRGDRTRLDSRRPSGRGSNRRWRSKTLPCRLSFRRDPEVRRSTYRRCPHRRMPRSADRRGTPHYRGPCSASSCRPGRCRSNIVGRVGIGGRHSCSRGRPRHPDYLPNAETRAPRRQTPAATDQGQPPKKSSEGSLFQRAYGWRDRNAQHSCETSGISPPLRSHRHQEPGNTRLRCYEPLAHRRLTRGGMAGLAPSSASKAPLPAHRERGLG
jgi:hypothetical protein